VDELLADGATPEDLGFDDIEFVVVFFADLVPVLGVGEDFIGDGDSIDEDHEVFRETVSLGAAVFCGAWFFLLRPVRRSLGKGGCGCFTAWFRKRFWLSQQEFVHFELELVGVELLGAGSEEALLEACNDLVLSGELGLEVGVLGLQADKLFLKLSEALE
jgi:hypothetical protein